MRRFPGSWSTTLSKLGLKLVRRTPSKRRVRGGGYGRRPSIESLECRQLLTGSPWAGNDLIIGDFDGDGNLDRLGNMAVSTTDPLVWNVDTKASSAAGMTESWRLTSLKPLPQINEFLVGDFNADGRDDILSRAGGSSWYMIQSRSTAQSGYSGEFAVYTSWGVFDAVGGWSTPIVGDFNGDGRDDVAAFNDFNPADKQWQVRISTGTSWELAAAWTTQSSIAPVAGSIVAGDFNGDGRDDLLFKKSGTQNWAIAVSDGTRFNVFDPTPIATTPWTAGHIGDFDGDGADELLGWNSTGTPHWETVRYTDHGGLSVDTSWGNHLSAIVTDSNLHIGDANRDGRDDLIVFNTGASAWTVALSQQTAAGTNAFTYTAPQSDGTNNWGRWFKDWDWGPTTAPYRFLNIDAPYQKFLDIFSDVYNNVELELYPGLMKGPQATVETKAGNSWDQVALSVDRLEAVGFDADILIGQVRASQNDVKSWIGAKDVNAAYRLLTQAFDPEAQEEAPQQTFMFNHVWVTAIVPTDDGLSWMDVDPSWKFKDTQPGIVLNPGGVGGLLTDFDSFAQQQLFTRVDGKFVKSQLPIESYEDQVVQYLASQNKHVSLAEVPYGGPIISKQFQKIPPMPSQGLQLIPGSPRRFDNFVDIAEQASQYAHTVKVDLQTSSGSISNKRLTVPVSAFDITKVWYTPGSDADHVVPHLTIAGENFTLPQVPIGSEVTLTISHNDPDRFGNLSGFDNQSDSYVRKAGQTLVLALDANQYSNQHIVDMQASLNDALETIAQDDIDDVLAFAGAKYWRNRNRDLRILNGLTQTIDVQQRVGSGIVTADSTYVIQPHLSIPLVPDGMNVDLKNSVSNPQYLASGGSATSLTDVHRMGVFNGSALEHDIVEEINNAESISTVKGIQLFLDKAASASYQVLVVERGPSDTTYRVTSIANRDGIQISGSPLTWDEATLRLNLSYDSSIENEVIQKLNATGATNRIWIPNDVTSIAASGTAPGWEGTVYIYESFGSHSILEYAIQRGGDELYYLGGYRGGPVLELDPNIRLGTTFQQTYAGDPVNVANGNMFRDELDFKFANPNIPLDFSRHYDSQNKLDVGFGVGWVHGFTGLVYEEQDPANAGDVDYVWLRGSGERHTFESLDFTLPNTLFGDVEKDANGLTKFLDRSGTQFIFQSIAGGLNDTLTGKKIVSRLIAIKDATGSQGVTISYDDVGAVKSVRVKEVHSLSTPGRYLQFVYSGNNIEVKRYDAGQHIATWAYVLTTNAAAYAGNRLTQVKHANLTTNVTNYLYYDDGPASRRGLIKKITEPNLESHTYEYYANGRVFRVTDGAGNQQSFNYNLFRNLTEFTDENGNVETYIHQDNGLLTKQIHDDRSRLEYTWGQQSANNTVEWEEFLMQSSTDERGGKEVFTYRIYNSSNPFSRPGELQTSKSKDDILTTFAYDDSQAYISSVTSVTQTPLNGTQLPNTEYTYDMYGHILTAKDAAGHITKYEYYDSAAPAHLRGLRKSETLPKGVSTQVLADGEVYEAVPWQVLSSAFTITGDTISVQLRTPASGQYVVADAIRVDRLDKDGVYRRIIDSSATGGDPDFRIGAGGGTTQSGGSDAYGSSYVRIAGTSPEQAGATWIFDNLEPGTYRISASWQSSTSNSTAATYWLHKGLPDGTPEASISGINQTVPPSSFRSYQTLFDYDTAGNLTRSITEGLPSSRRAYDSFGNVVYAEDATGVATVYTYDALGRLQTSEVVASTPVEFAPDRSTVVKSWSGPAPGYDIEKNSWNILDGGNTLHLFGNSRKAVAINYNVTANTVLEFDFKATTIGEYQGIAVGDSLSLDVIRGFKLTGTDPNVYGPTWLNIFPGDLYETADGIRHYRINLGDAFGSGSSPLIGPPPRVYLVFVNADTGGNYGNTAGESFYSNLRLYEAGGNPQAVRFQPDQSTSVLSWHGPGPDPGFDVQADQWEVKDDGAALYLKGNTRKAFALNHAIETNTVLEFDLEIAEAGEFLGIALANSLTDQTAMTLSFRLGGSDPNSYGWNTQYLLSPSAVGKRHIRIPIGQIATGSFPYLVFVNADSVSGSGPGPGKSLFSNIRLYDAAGINKTSYIYDDSGRVASVTDALSNRTTYKYDAAGRLINTSFPDRTFTTHQYDDFGNCIATTDEIGRTTHYVYDDRNRLIQTIYPDGNSTRVRYDGSGQIVSSFDERGTETRFTYDKAGRLLTTITAPGLADEAKIVHKYDSRGRRVESVDANGVVTKYMYDDLDRLVQTTVLDKTHTSPNVTTLTPVISSKLPVQVSTIEYDSNGNVARTAVFDPRKFVVTTPPSTPDYSTLLNNAVSLISTPNESDNKVQVVRTVHDAFGRPNKTTNADGYSTSTIYDAAGRVRFTFDELGRKTEQRYDQYGRLERIVAPDPDGSGAAASHYIRYVRDLTGKVWFEWEYVGLTPESNAAGETANWFNYDTRGLIKRRSDKYDSELTRFVYDVAGQLVSTIDALGNADFTRYDERGRVISQRLADPDGSGPQFAPVTTQTYDEAGNIETTTDARGSTTTFTYDKLNRLKTETSHHELLLDDSADTLDVAFTVNTGTPYPEQRGSSAGGDYTAVQSAAATVTWTTGPLDAGRYRVSATWFAHFFWANVATANVYKNGQLVAAPQIDQTKSPVGFEAVDGDVSRVWQVLKDGVDVAAGDTISVQLVRIAGTYSYLLADAIRVDRESVTEYGYDKNGNLTSEIDSRGYTSSYVFDELGRQIKAKTPDPDGAGAGNLPQETTTIYDGYGNVISAQRAHYTSPTTVQVTRTDNFEYDRRNRLTKEILNVNAGTDSDDNVTTQYAYDAVGNLVSQIDALDHETQFRYDNANRRIDEYNDYGEGRQAPLQLGALTATGAGSHNLTDGTLTLVGDKSVWATIPSHVVTHQTVLEFTLDVADLAAIHAVGFDTDSSYSITEKARYFELGGFASSPALYTTDFREERLSGRSVTFHIPIGQYLTAAEKAAGLAITRLAFLNIENRTGLATEDIGKSAFSNIRLYESEEVRTVTTYDIRGNVEKVREASDPRSVVTRYEYDRRGRTKKRILDSGGTQQVTYETVYDSVGNVKEEWNLTAGTKTVHDYDRLNRRTKTTLPDPDGIPGGATGSASEVKTFSFDVAGNLIAETNGENETTRWLYDEQGNVVSETDGNGDETRYRYDSEGNQTAVIDAEQNVTRYKYDGLNRVTDETIKATVSSTDTLLARHYVYSAAGNLERIFDRNNRHIHYLYDSLDRKITEYWRPTAYVYGEAPVHVLSWEYDKLGRVIKQVDGNANYGSAADDLVDTYVYDGLGRVTQQANYDPNQTNQGSGSGVPRVRQEFEYEYRHESGAFHDRVIRSQFGPFGGSEVAIAETISEYDRLGRLKSLDDLDNDPGAATPVVGQKSLTFSYDTADNLTGISRSNPSTTVNSTLVYDRTNRVTSVTHDLGPAGSSATDIVHSYGYDNASRVTSFNTTGSVAATRAYQYDDAGQLTSKSGSTGPESYTYDDNGNRELVTNGQGTNQDYVAAHANRLESDGTYTYQYDKEGNVTDRWVTLDPGQRIYYTWDHRNRLTKVSEWNGDHEVLIVDYKYDASGRLVSKATNRPFDTGIVETEYFVHDSNG
ncbi:MAG: FG-GAP-like repeat-containing protein, partial [Pirellulales bacterium]